MGFGGSSAEAGRALRRSGDDGVDGVIDQDAFGLDRVYIQAKRYALGNNIGLDAIREFFGSLDLHKVTKGLFVTTSTFSPSATKTPDSWQENRFDRRRAVSQAHDPAQRRVQS
jgi:restriction system protein